MSIANDILRKYAELIADSLTWEGMETYLSIDGDMGVRQEGSFSQDEDEVIHRTNLSKWYWSDHWLYLNDEDINDPDTRELFIDTLMEIIPEHINSES